MEQDQITCRQWAEEQFALAELGDKRRSKRLVKVASTLAGSPGATLSSVLPRWSDIKAAYRLLGAGGVTYESVQAPHLQKTREVCGEPGTYLMIEDTTEIDLSQRRDVEDLGWIGNGHGWGFYLHTTLALRVHGWDAEERPEVQLVGLLDQKWWVRKHEPRRQKEKRCQRMKRARESERWAAVFQHVVPPPEAHWVYVADRESDIYEAFLCCMDAGVHFVIRARHERAQADKAETSFEAVSGTECLGTFSLQLRARPGVSARTAKVEVRSSTVKPRPPYRWVDGPLPPIQLNVVEAREVDAPEGVHPIHWILVTDEPCGTFAESRRVIGMYAQRWLIEEYHKALKSGTGIERTQLSTADRILALCGVLAIVAVRLISMKLLARTSPDEPINEEILGSEAVTILEAKYGRPKGGWTNLTALVCIARLGGFLARKSDGAPGWLTIWRGWQRLMIMVQGFLLAKEVT